MTSELLAIFLLLLAGLPMAVWLEPSLGFRARLGIAFMLGSGCAAFLMLVSTLAGIEWSRELVVGTLAIVSCASLPFALRGPGRERVERAHFAAHAADAATLVSVTGFALFATTTRPWEWDFWAIWGLKAKEFFVARGVSFDFLARPDNYSLHPDYPPLLPLVYDFVALIEGRWDDRWMGLVSVAFAISMLLVIREELERQCESAVVGALGTLALSGVACSPWVGIGEGPLVALVSAGLLVLSRGLRDESVRTIATGSLLVGLAALAKNEGTSLAVATAVVALVVTRRKWMWVVFPMLLVTAPWFAARAGHALSGDILEGSFASRVAERLSDPLSFMRTLGTGRFERLEFWVILGLVLAMAPSIIRRERFLLGVIGLQTMTYVAVYAGTVYELGWHVRNSLGRVSSQLAPLIGIVVVLGIGALLKAPPAPLPQEEDEVEPGT